MIIHPTRRTVILSPNESKGVLSAIPHAKQIEYQGLQLLAVPHGLQEAKVLRNLGLTVRSPILDYYHWPRNKHLVPKPFEAQTKTAAFLTMHPRSYCLNGLGSGKTLAALWAHDYLRSVGMAKKLLVVCTLSTVDEAWGNTIRIHFPHLSHIVVHGTRKKRVQLLKNDADIYVVNHHGVEVVLEELQARADIDSVVIDELADAARNQRTNMWRALDSVINAVAYKEDNTGSLRRHGTSHRVKHWVWGLTATPIPNKPTDAYAQVKLITPNTAPKSFTRFRDATMRQMSQFKWVSKADALETVFQVMVPAIRFSREECVDLPPTIPIFRSVQLSKEQERMFRQMQSTLVAEHAAGQITAANEGVKIIKLLQIVTGFVYDGDGNAVHLDTKPRLEETLRLVHESGSKTLVFVPFVQSVSIVADYLRKNGVSVEVVYGEVGKSQRTDIFQRFQRDSDPQVLVCQPEVMAHGLTLTAAAMSVWYAPYFKSSVYEHANGRTPRPGQKLNTVIAHVYGTAVEKRIYERLRDNVSMQGVLLDMIREGRE